MQGSSDGGFPANDHDSMELATTDNSGRESDVKIATGGDEKGGKRDEEMDDFHATHVHTAACRVSPNDDQC